MPADSGGGPGSPAASDGVALARAALAAARAAARARGRVPGLPGAPRASTGAGRPSGAHPDDRDPQPVGASIRRLLAERGWESDLAVGGVFARWPAIVGADVSAHVTPETLDAGQLVLRADSTAWATQVRLLVPVLIARLDTELGGGTVRTVRVLGPAPPSWKKGTRSVPGRGPRDTYG